MRGYDSYHGRHWFEAVSVLTHGGVTTSHSRITRDIVLLGHSSAAIVPCGGKLTWEILFPFITGLGKPGARAHSWFKKKKERCSKQKSIPTQQRISNT